MPLRAVNPATSVLAPLLGVLLKISHQRRRNIVRMKKGWTHVAAGVPVDEVPVVEVDPPVVVVALAGVVAVEVELVEVPVDVPVEVKVTPAASHCPRAKASA